MTNGWRTLATSRSLPQRLPSLPLPSPYRLVETRLTASPFLIPNSLIGRNFHFRSINSSYDNITHRDRSISRRNGDFSREERMVKFRFIPRFLTRDDLYWFLLPFHRLHILLVTLVVRGLLSPLIQRIIVRISDRPLLRVIGNSRAAYLRMRSEMINR